ncbi:MAG: DUF1990 family protein [Rubricoccaceae bacterium]
MNDWQRHRKRLDALRTAPYNFDPELRHAYTEQAGWHLDDYAADLPPEPPGPPLAHGSFAIARRLMRDYAFPDPRLVTGIFVPDEPLSGRPMLLRARFLGFTFWFGVRLTEEIEELRGVGEAREHVWGYGYRTLEGHFERGEITFEVAKREATGAVAFRAHAYSQPDRIRNPFYRLGFRLFGRHLQRRFARTAMARMQRFVREELEARRAGEVPAPRETVPVAPAGEASPEAAAQAS